MLEIFSKFPATPLLTPRVSVTHYQSPLNHWLSGPEAYAEMCALRPDIKVIFTTGYTPKAKQLVSVIEKGRVHSAQALQPHQPQPNDSRRPRAPRTL